MGSIRKMWLPFCSVLLMSTLIADTTGLLIKRSTDDQNTQTSSGTSGAGNSPQGCGYRNRQNSADVNDYETTFGEFPWIVEVLNNAYDFHVTLGALIHPQVVVTSGYFIREFSAENYTIRAGAWSSTSPAQVQNRAAEFINTRKGFIEDPSRVGNDIALIRLAAPFDITPNVNVVCMPNQDESFDNYKDCDTFEWAKGGSSGLGLLKLDLDMPTRSTCNQKLQATGLGPDYSMHETIVCAAKEGTTLCQGDPGAPLVCPVGNNRYKLTGLATGGLGCNGNPGLYSRVASFRQWVDDVMQEWGFDTSSYQI